MSTRLTRGWLVRAGIASAVGAAAILAAVTVGAGRQAQAAPPDVTMTVSIPSGNTQAVGATFNVEVNAVNNNTVTWAGWNDQLAYTSSIVKVNSVSDGGLCTGSWGSPQTSPTAIGACAFATSTASGRTEVFSLTCLAVGTSPLHLVTLVEDGVQGTTFFDATASPFATALNDSTVNCKFGQQKSHAGGATLIAGTTVTYTIHVDGPASGVSVHGLSISDQLPVPPLGGPFTVTSTFGVADGCGVTGGGLVTCPTLSANVTTGNTITVTAAIPLSAAGATNVCNQSMGVTGVTNSNIDCFNVAPAHLTVQKVVNGGPFQSGDPFTWTVTVTSDGGSPAANVVVTDTATDGFDVATLGTVVVSGPCVVGVVTPGLNGSATFTSAQMNPGDVCVLTIAGNEHDPNPGDNNCNNSASAKPSNGLVSNTAAASVVCASKNVRMVKDTDGNLNDDPQLANLFLCVGPTCTSNGMGYLDITENIMNIGSDPQGVGAFEFQVKYDNHIFDITICEGDDAAPPPANGCAAAPAGGSLGDPSHWLYSTGRIPGAVGIGGCAATIITENDIRFGCVSKDNPAILTTPGCLGPEQQNAQPVLHIECGPKNDGIAATIHVKPKADLASRITPGNDNGAIRTLLDEGCEVADIWGHPLSAANGQFDPTLHAPNNGYDALGREIPLPGILPGGQVADCADITITVRVLEGDMNKDCIVDITDDQIEASHYGAFFGVLLYQPWFDLEPALKDGDVDIKDLQKVFGRNGSKCSDPIPPQPPLPDPDP